MLAHRRICTSLAAALAGLLALPSHAAEGALEINQACAVSTGCFAGDAPGFPVTIQAPPAGPGSGSYRLTGNLALPSPDTVGIQIAADAVVLDLGGFTLDGPTLCTSVPVTSCTPRGAGIGILGASNVTVRNGSVTGAGDDGVRLGAAGRAEGLNAFHNGGDGLVIGNEGIARGNIVSSNGGDGIRCGERCVVSGNTSSGNQLDGIDVTSGAVTGNASSQNGGRGGQFGAQTTFAQNMFGGNGTPDQLGGHASGGNLCEDASCSAARDPALLRHRLRRRERVSRPDGLRRGLPLRGARRDPGSVLVALRHEPRIPQCRRFRVAQTQRLDPDRRRTQASPIHPLRKLRRLAGQQSLHVGNVGQLRGQLDQRAAIGHAALDPQHRTLQQQPDRRLVRGGLTPRGAYCLRADRQRRCRCFRRH